MSPSESMRGVQTVQILPHVAPLGAHEEEGGQGQRLGWVLPGWCRQPGDDWLLPEPAKNHHPLPPTLLYMQSKLWSEGQLTLHPPAYAKIQWFRKRKSTSKMHLQLWEAVETFLLLEPHEDLLLWGRNKTERLLSLREEGGSSLRLRTTHQCKAGASRDIRQGVTAQGQGPEMPRRLRSQLLSMQVLPKTEDGSGGLLKAEIQGKTLFHLRQEAKHKWAAIVAAKVWSPWGRYKQSPGLTQLTTLNLTSRPMASKKKGCASFCI